MQWISTLEAGNGVRPPALRLSDVKGTLDSVVLAHYELAVNTVMTLYLKSTRSHLRGTRDMIVQLNVDLVLRTYWNYNDY